MLVALDDSPAAARALEYAIELRRRDRGELILCTAVDNATIAAATGAEGMSGIALTTIDDMSAAAKALLENAAARSVAAGTPATTLLLEGKPSAAIVSCARERSVDAIVMGTHGSRGLERLLLGSTADGVLRATDIPTFVVHRTASDIAAAPGFMPASTIGRILVALDRSDASDAALEFALDLASAKRSRLVFCTVVGFDSHVALDAARTAAADHHEASVKAARKRGLDARSTIVEGDPAAALLAAATECGADLIAIGTHGRQGLHRLIFGSVAESVVCRSTLPVVVVHAAAKPQRAKKTA